MLPLLVLLWSKKAFILPLAALGCLAAVVFATLQAPIYSADALVQLENENSGITLSEDIANLMSQESESVTEIEIIKSRMILGETVEVLQLDISAEPRRLPVVGNFLSRSNFERPQWNWLSRYAWNQESISVSSIKLPIEMYDESVSYTHLTLPTIYSV